MPRSHQDLDVAAVCVAGHWRLSVRGELDLCTGGQLAALGGRLAAAQAPAVDLDLGGVTFVDTAGWRAVLSVAAAVTAAGGTSALVAVAPAVHALLERVGRATTPGYRAVTEVG